MRSRRMLISMKKVIFLLLIGLTLSAATLERGSPGRVRYVVRTDPDWDRFTRGASRNTQEWFRSHVWRMMVLLVLGRQALVVPERLGLH